MAEPEQDPGAAHEPGDAHPQRGQKHARLIERVAALPPVPAAVVHPCSPDALAAALDAAELGLVSPVLVGPRAKIEAAASAAGRTLDGVALVDAAHSHDAADRAVALVREGRAALLIKGSLHSDELLAAVLARTGGLRTERRLSHAFIMDVPGHPRALIITDAAVNIIPSLEDKIDIVQNAIDLAQAIGTAEPKVAILSAVETVSPKLPGTIEAAALCKMAERGQITGALLDGPLAFDLAISPEAARVKGIGGPVAGAADILVVPDLEAGNMLAKSLSFLMGAEAAGLVLGARVPVVLTSRADSRDSRLASVAVAVQLVEHRRAQARVPG